MELPIRHVLRKEKSDVHLQDTLAVAECTRIFESPAQVHSLVDESLEILVLKTFVAVRVR